MQTYTRQSSSAKSREKSQVCQAWGSNPFPVMSSKMFASLKAKAGGRGQTQPTHDCAPGDDTPLTTTLRSFFLRVTNFFQSVWMQQGTDVSTPKGWISSKANTRIPNRTYNMGVHSGSATSSWLYYGTPTGCTFSLQYYHLRRGCVGTC